MKQTSEIKTSGGIAQFELLEGAVQNHQTQRWAETHVSGGGGGGYVHPTHGGHVHTGGVSSSIVNREHTQFWLTDQAGVQHAVQLSNDTMPTADGQKVRVVWGCKKGNSSKTILYARNYASQTDVIASDKELAEWMNKQYLFRYPALYRLIFFHIPVLFVFYIAFVWAPLVNVMIDEGIIERVPRFHSEFAYFGNAFLVHFDHLDLWTPQIMLKETLGRGLGIKSTLAFLFVIVLFQAVARIIGRILIGGTIRKRALVPLRKKLEEIVNLPPSQT